MDKEKYLPYVFEEVYSCEYATVTYCADLKMAVCKSVNDYIPIKAFKVIFTSVSTLIEEIPVNFFLFDKRSLRTFHQPSMEWYFAIWKPEMKIKGLYNHFKILPNLEWFEKAVQAGKHEIFQKYGKDILHGIQVTYVDSLEDAIDIVSGITN